MRVILLLCNAFLISMLILAYHYASFAAPFNGVNGQNSYVSFWIFYWDNLCPLGCL